MKKLILISLLSSILLSSCGENSLGSKGSSLVAATAPPVTPIFEVGEDISLTLDSAFEFSEFSNSKMDIENDELKLSGNTILESGRIILSDSINSGHVQLVAINNTFIDPVVVAHIITNNDSDTAEVRIRNITPSGFEIFMEEPDGSSHGAETVAYFIFEKGEYTLSNGVKIEADTSATLSEHFESAAFTTDTITLDHTFASAPNVFSTLNSYNNAEFKASLVSGVSSTNFNLQQSTLGSGTSTVSEDIGWAAISNFSGLIQAKRFQIENQDPGGSHGVDNATPVTFTFASFGAAPNIISEGRSGNGADGYFARGSGLWSDSAYGVYAWEDIVNDGERAHTNESFSMLAADDEAGIKLFESSASFETQAIDISTILSYQSSSVSFIASLDAGVSFTLDYAISSDGGSTWSPYTSIASGNEMENLVGIADFSDHQLKLRGTVTNTNNLSSFTMSELSINIENN